jgi:hypothetical protein
MSPPHTLNYPDANPVQGPAQAKVVLAIRAQMLKRKLLCFHISSKRPANKNEHSKDSEKIHEKSPKQRQTPSSHQRGE